MLFDINGKKVNVVNWKIVIKIEIISQIANTEVENYKEDVLLLFEKNEQIIENYYLLPERIKIDNCS